MTSDLYTHTDRVSPREQEVFQALFDHSGSYERVAQALFIAPTTVKTHVNRLFNKLRVNDKTALIIEGLKNGYINVDGIQRLSSPKTFLDAGGKCPCIFRF